MPKPKFSSSRVCFKSMSVLQVVVAGGGGDVGFHSPVQKLALLALRGGRILVEGIAAGVVVELVLADVWIDGQQACGR